MVIDIRTSLSSTRQKVVMGIDPGDLTGVAIVEHSGASVYIANIPAEDMPDFLLTNSDYLKKLVTHIVYEDYLLYGHKAKQQTGSKFKAVQVIGQLRMWAKMNNIPMTSQQARILSIAEKWSQITPKGKHQDTHFVDAFNHAFYWLVKNGLAKTRLEREQERQKENGKAKEG